MSRARVQKLTIARFGESGLVKSRDRVAGEEPLEIRVAAAGEASQSLAITMRTPGEDFELVAGFLYSEGLFAHPEQVETMSYCTGPNEQEYNTVRLNLRSGVPFDRERFRRNVYTSSSCGVCGKQSLDQIEVQCPRKPRLTEPIDPVWITTLPDRLRQAQQVFETTGGLHAAAALALNSDLLLLREDVGRHNATDKLVGRLFLDRRLPADEHLLLLSGRASFELLHKAVTAGFGAVAALGAPSSLAVDLAKRFDVTLLGFVKPESFNVYHGKERLAPQ